MKSISTRCMVLAVVLTLGLTLISLSIAFAAEMVLVQGGEFTMGDALNKGSEFEKPAHRVRLSDFYIAKYKLTFDEC